MEDLNQGNILAYKEYNKPLNTIEILTEESGCPYVRIEGVTMKNILIFQLTLLEI